MEKNKSATLSPLGVSVLPTLYLLFQHDGTQPIFKWFFKRPPPTIWKILFVILSIQIRLSILTKIRKTKMDNMIGHRYAMKRWEKFFFVYDEIKFVGINFNSRIKNPSEEFYQNMINRARERGLGFYID